MITLSIGFDRYYCAINICCHCRFGIWVSSVAFIYQNEVYKLCLRQAFNSAALLTVQLHHSSGSSAWGSSVQLQRLRSVPEIISKMLPQMAEFTATGVAKAKNIKGVRLKMAVINL